MSTSNKVLAGFKWTTLEKLISQFIQFVITIIIARLVTPGEYGILGILLVFINLSQVFIEGGLGSALVYFNKMEKTYFNTTFIFNLLVSSVLFVTLFFSAHSIEIFYALENLALYMRISAVVLLSNSLIVVPTAIFQIQLDFKALSISNILSTVVSATVGLILAYLGYGVWSLIFQLLSKSISLSILLLLQCQWFPRLEFDVLVFKQMYKYAINLFTTNLLTKFTCEGISSVIAKYISPASLGVYTRSNQFAAFPQSCLGSIVNTVMFPSLASVKDNHARFDNLFRKAITVQSALTIPVYMWLAMESKPIVLLLLTERWVEVVPVLQILCLGRILSLVSILSEQTLTATGRSDLFFKQQMIKIFSLLLLVMVALPFGIVYVALADAFQTICQFFITASYSNKVNRVKLVDQLKLICPYFFSAGLSALLGYMAIIYFDNYYLELLISCCIALISYCLSLKIFFKNEMPLFLMNSLFSKIKSMLTNS